MTHVLSILTGKFKGKMLRLSPGENFVGREEGLKIRIASDEISRRHCVLIPQTDASVLVRDLESRNRTFINGMPIDGERVLLPGDTLSVGPMTFQLAVPPSLPTKAGSDPNREVVKPPSDPSVAVPKRSPKASDDDIASWLGEEAVSASDTTIVPRNSSPLSARRKKKAFQSIAEEATDIIRRHREMQAAREE